MQAEKRILVARMGRVGDMVMVTPAIRAILAKYPDTKLTFLTSNDGIRSFKGFSERIDKFVVYDRKSLLPWLTRYKIKNTLQAEQYDRIYCFESKPSFLTLFNKLDTTLHKLPATADKSIHYAQQCLNLVNPDDSDNKMSIAINLPVTQTAQTDANKLLAASDITDQTFVIGLHPSFSGLAKSFSRAKKSAHHRVWPIEFWSDLAIKINDYAKQQQLNIKIMIDLVPEELDIGAKIKQLSNGAALYQCPPLNFERYKATLARYDLLITPDSGPMHIAAAVNTKVIALFSSHQPSDCQPFVDQQQFTVLRAEDTDQPEKGLAAIDPETVFKACLKFL